MDKPVPKPDRKSIAAWDRAKRDGRVRALITAYDYPFARLASEAGIDGILIGDSLGMTVQGHEDTLRVSLEQMIYHTEIVARAAPECLIMADLPFGSFESSPSKAFDSATLLLKAGADIVKLEGGAAMVETVGFLSARAVPVCAHIGLTPQHVRQFGGFRKQGKTADAAARLRTDAVDLAEAGARMVLMEAIPADLAAEITRAVPVPTVGIGAGGGTDAQILVLHDVLGLTSGYVPGFARTYLDGSRLVREAIETYATDVRARRFPQ
ncbi:3-methyl-2-oxobutanoate hydroxymethyltransferase [Acidiphilium acidophilum]|uniref:3-methyl-2-oxobutanoate hydroxymethyltransferase n=1 Tax=Acidiphilium acidophilum TaxID=76588 RepID=A0AAW9DPF0_ACIAO|nr:3-methyl-2-oxobutanoate hydroxymethyltransferase [Acidiphilium acidophilum]MDX5930971.1 3-methyl-2-oxobutanoate hydroxymethyltransferase [Acidiphilium acidophilum]GBQ18498.1 ketopantoate hydroxymethyltransferase [Acidiphilium acidophilum DSM 700]